MTRQQFDALMKDASHSVKDSGKRAIAESYEDRNNRPSSSPESEPPVLNDLLAAGQGEAANQSRVSICITSYRRRLTDPDNLCGKYFLDLLRYSGLIRDDREADISYKIAQVKVAKKEAERTVIELEYPSVTE